MQLILVTNLYEDSKLSDFITHASSIYPDANYFVAGDLLNSSPPPEADLLERSILGELFGLEVIHEMHRLAASQWLNVDQSFMVGIYRDMILPTGRFFERAQRLADQRYGNLFAELEGALKGRKMYFTPGNTDYPLLSYQHAQNSTVLHYLDHQVIEMNGVRVGALGGVPNTIHPFRGVVEVSPYEMSEAEYERRLRNLNGIDVLVTLTSFGECGPFFINFLKESSVKILICREPYHARRYQDTTRVTQTSLGQTKIIELCPFGAAGFLTPVLTLSCETLSDPRIEFLRQN